MTHILSCDWGTSTFRLRVLDVATGKICQEVRSAEGISKIHQDWIQNHESENRILFFRRQLLKALKEFGEPIEPDTPIIISGMASSSIGIVELPYRSVPFVLNTDLPVGKLIEQDNQFPYPMYLVSGFNTPTDVMRGEETMLLGIDNFVKNEICILPGTHSKHAYINSGVLTDFKTYVTGELFNMMTQFSILSNSVQKGEDANAFEAGVEEAASGTLLNQFFKIRARQLLNKTSDIYNYQFLSGLLIGTELRELEVGSYKIRLVSDEPMTSLYIRALKKLSFEVTVASATETLIKGHLKIYKTLRN